MDDFKNIKSSKDVEDLDEDNLDHKEKFHFRRKRPPIIEKADTWTRIIKREIKEEKRDK